MTREVLIAGGASTIRQALAAGVLDELYLDIAPMLLGGGERLFDGVADPGPDAGRGHRVARATHIRYGIGEL